MYKLFFIKKTCNYTLKIDDPLVYVVHCTRDRSQIFNVFSLRNSIHFLYTGIRVHRAYKTYTRGTRSRFIFKALSKSSSNTHSVNRMLARIIYARKKKYDSTLILQSTYAQVAPSPPFFFLFLLSFLPCTI